MGKKGRLQPRAAVGPVVRATAEAILGRARAAIADPELSHQDAVHYFRRAIKEWRALMRLLAPFIADAKRLRTEARDHARSLAQARDGQAALNALGDLLDNGLVLSARSSATIRERLEALRASEEAAVLTPAKRDAIIAWLDAASAVMAGWPFEAIEFPAIAGRLTAGYKSARRCLPEDWGAASPEELHQLRQRVVDHRCQMELIEPLWPRFGQMWTKEAERLRQRLGRCQDLEVLKRLTGVHQPLARWRSRLEPACTDHTLELSNRAARIARRLFAEKPKAFRHRLETLWEHGH